MDNLQGDSIVVRGFQCATSITSADSNGMVHRRIKNQVKWLRIGNHIGNLLLSFLCESQIFTNHGSVVLIKLELFSDTPAKPIMEKISHVSNLQFINSLVIDVI